MARLRKNDGSCDALIECYLITRDDRHAALKHTNDMVGRDSAVARATPYGPDGPGIESG